MGEILWQAPNIQKCSVCGNKICKGFAFVIVWRTEKNEEISCFNIIDWPDCFGIKR